jgi:hypothetical protein
VEFDVAANVPGAHAVQELFVTELPAGQAIQPVLPSAEVLPAGHGPQIFEPGSEENVPAAQGVQLVELAIGENFPAGQTIQVLLAS